MVKLGNMPLAGVVVIAVIAVLFALAMILLFSVYFRYKHLASQVKRNSPNPNNAFLRTVVNDYAAAYKQMGSDVNTPAVIESGEGARLGDALLCERFLNNAVSLFVTLGLFGTFLGLSLSVASLTELISYSNSTEWLSVLDSVGGGLMSALSGMGVAFYTSLVGVAASILLTVFRTIFNPQNQREIMETQLELWLDQTVAPTLATDKAKDDAGIVRQMVEGMNKAADAMEKTLSDATAAFQQSLDNAKSLIVGFNKTVGAFNDGVHGFTEFDYNLRGTVERMDVASRSLVDAVRRASRSIERGGEQ